MDRFHLDRCTNWLCKRCSPNTSQHDAQAPEPAYRAPKASCYIPGCKTTIRENSRRLSCCSCPNQCHLSPDCSKLTRDAANVAFLSDSWSCNDCRAAPPADDPIPSGFADNIAVKSEPSPGKFLTRPLRILQWNADGINTKLLELSSYLSDHTIDIALIQESKLIQSMATPTIKGYATKRTDRKNAVSPGGGLLMFIRNNLAFKCHSSTSRGAVESQSISIQQSAKRWLNLVNIYIPKGEMDLSWLPLEPNTIYAGDFNGHSLLWDDNVIFDARGKAIEDWILSNSLVCLNTGTATRINKATGGLSTPDITIAHSSISNKLAWSVCEPLNSDHLPLVTEVRNGATRTVNTSKVPTRWRSKGVDWSKFREEVESLLPLNPTLSASQRSKRLSSILSDTASTHVGRTKPRRAKHWMNPKLRSAIKKRNILFRSVSTKRAEWLEAVKEVRDVTAESKLSSWTAFLDDLETSQDTSRTWKVIRSLDGTPDSAAPSEALRHNNRDITTDTQKANTFGKHYASVSRLKFSRKERATNRKSKQATRPCLVDDDHSNDISCAPITLTELKNAIKAMKPNGAPGPDDIPPSFLKALGPKALDELLTTFNDSFRNGDIPQLWRQATIIPVLKAGKPASKIESFRPISLTSCVVKVLEKILYNRLYHLAETKKWLSNIQPGFRKSRSCEDQVLRFNQHISDGFQLDPPKRTVMALLDYSKAFDQVWREKLILCMLDLGVPLLMVRWIKSFLTNRLAKVKVNGTLGRTFTLRQGVPQGSVLSPSSSSCLSTTSLMSSQPTRTVPSSLMTPPSGRVTSNFAPPTRICAKRLPLSPVGVLGKNSP